MVWNIVKIASADDLEVVKLVLTVVGFSLGWILIASFFPFFFWLGPLLIGRHAANNEDPRQIPSNVESSLLHRVGENVIVKKSIEVDGIAVEENSKVMVVGLGSNYYEIMAKGKRIRVPASIID